MKRLGLLSMTGIFVLIATLSSQGVRPVTGTLQVQVESRNPWTSLKLNNDPAHFRFALVSDRTGGHRARIFSQAVGQLNLMQPEFVICVGDLIEGGTTDVARLSSEWKEFQSYVSLLQMPFFYLPGNHDMANGAEEKLWQEKFGRRYYHFVYRDVLFLMLNSDDPPGKGGGIGAEQLAYAQQALAQNRGVRWTFVILHRPLWTEPQADKNGWPEVEKALAGRNYTVFCGHIHRYHKFTRNGMSYYQLATTGGASKVRGVPYGEFDHITWVTMKNDGPVLANILLDGIYPDDMKKIVSDEPGQSLAHALPTHPVKGRLLVDGCPVPGAVVVFHGTAPATVRSIRADGVVEADGTFTLSTAQAFDGAPAGEYVVTVTWPRPSVNANGLPGPNQLPPRFANPDTSPLRAKVDRQKNEFLFELQREVPERAADQSQ